MFKLLNGLNSVYDDVRGRLLAREPLPSVREAFTILRYEKSRRMVMLPDKPHLDAPHVHSIEALALATRANQRTSDRFL